MPRTARIAPGNVIFHVLNRANARVPIFTTEADYSAFEGVLAETQRKIPMRILTYCLMPNHWHLVLQPYQDGDLGQFMHRLTTTHVRRWHQYRDTQGHGHLYQGTYKSFPVQEEGHFLTVCRYVERNALNAGLVGRAEEWRWSGLGRKCFLGRGRELPVLHPWPLVRPEPWSEFVNRPLTLKEQEMVRESIRRGKPLGQEAWQKEIAVRLGLESTLRTRGRPRKRG